MEETPKERDVKLCYRKNLLKSWIHENNTTKAHYNNWNIKQIFIYESGS